jgi:hypothetical protein
MMSRAVVLLERYSSSLAPPESALVCAAVIAAANIWNQILYRYGVWGDLVVGPALKKQREPYNNICWWVELIKSFCSS